MPYEIRPVSKGYKVFKEGTKKSYSKKPLSLETAKAQMRAIYANERMQGGIDEDTRQRMEQHMKDVFNQHGDKIVSGTIDFFKDQLKTKEEREAESRKKREEIEERERREREEALPSLGDLWKRFSGDGKPVKMAQPDYYKEHRNIVGLLNKTGKALLNEAKDQQQEATAMARKMGARNPFYHLRGTGWGPDGVYIEPTIEDIQKHYDKPIQPPPVFDDEPEELMMQRYYYSQKAPGKYRPSKKRGGMINPFDKNGNLLPQFQQGADDIFSRPAPPEFDWIENERRTTNPFYHLSGFGEQKELNLRKPGDDPRNWGYDEEDEAPQKDAKDEKLPEQPNFVFGDNFNPDTFFKPQPYDPNNPMMYMAGSGVMDDMAANFKLSPIGQLVDGVSRNKPLTNLLGKAGDFLADRAGDALFNMFTGGIAHNPKGHTTRNNNLTKQTPRKKKFCGFVAKKFEHEDYDPAKLHKFRAATCGGEPLSHGGRPAGAKNKQGYTRSGQFTEGRRQYGQSKKFRERIMGEGRQLQIMPEEDDLVSKKENPVVDKIIHEPMDDGDIRAYFPNARVMRYADLADYESIEEVLPKDKSYAILLYQHRPNDGHFVCIMRYGKTIEFFCSYGSKIDGPLYWTALKDRKALGEGKPYLSMLLKKASKEFKAVHNPVDFQSKKDGVATCGAYCVVRINQLVNHNQDLHEFIDWMEEIKKDTGLSYDEIVANYVNKR